MNFSNIETLQNIIENQAFPNLIKIEKKVTSDKDLFTYQEEALINAQKALLVYFNQFGADKYKFCESYYHQNELYPNLHLPVNELKISKQEINEFFNIEIRKNKEVILFDEIVNRISFWMATGSGKTIVILKLIEMLFNMMDSGLIPKKDIMFLTYREDLLINFINLIEEYNKDKSLQERIAVCSLKDYEYQKTNRSFGKQIFIYRSDLISNERKETILNYKDYLTQINNKTTGNWYLILDEAHKGATDSKRQTYYSILSQNGFLFNFSATFVELLDKVTTIYNLNLNEFIKRGYGKQIYVLQDEIKKAFKKQKDFETTQKVKIVLKNFIILSAVKKASKKLPSNFYHNPMLIFLMSSVNIDNSDLLLIFNEIAELGKKIDITLLNEVKNEIISEFKNAAYTIGNGNLKDLNTIIRSISKNDIFQYIYNSDTEGNVEIKRTKNNQELILKLDTSDKPFALVKIGNTNELIKKHLSKKYKIDNSFENESFFLKLNDKDSSINILLGSRAFYEGWDSNRPNIITFINIGTGNEAKKFVLQSIGRGIRIEPFRGYRQRRAYINDSNITHTIQNNLTETKFLETLFVFATNKNAVETILEELQSIKMSDSFKEISLAKNQQIKIDLFYPQYAGQKNDITNLKNPLKYCISKNDLDILTEYLKCIPKKVFLVKYGTSSDNYMKLLYILEKKEKFFRIDNTKKFHTVDILVKNLLNYFAVDIKHLKDFDIIRDDCIVHFKKIKVLPEKLQRFQKILEAASYVPEKTSLPFEDIFVTKLSQHFYTPILYKDSNNSEINWIKNIIDVTSESCFIETLIPLIDTITEKYDWCFSKLNEKYDKKIFIPYLKDGETHPYYPDFIFWLKNKHSDDYKILFIDPKGMTHTDYQEKIEGFKQIFTENGKLKKFKKNSLNITVNLKMFACDSIDGINNHYIEYWVDKNTLHTVF